MVVLLPFLKFLASTMAPVPNVAYPKWWLMGDKGLRISWYACYHFGKAACTYVLHEHRYAKNLTPSNSMPELHR